MRARRWSRSLTAGAKSWSQDSSGVSGVAGGADEFGSSLLAVKIASTARSDLVIGIPEEDAAGILNCGMVELLRGSSSGLTATGSQGLVATSLLNGGDNFAAMGDSLA